MLKRFFISFLGSLAGICVAGIILFVAFLLILGAAASSEIKEKANVEEGSVLHLVLNGTVTDRLEPLPILDQITGNNPEIIPLNTLLGAIEHAAGDKKIDAIYLDCQGVTAGLAQIKAIVDALNRFKESGKPVYAYSDGYTQGNYVIASAADSIFANPEAMVDIHGLSSTTLYFKNFLDKIGVNVQVVKVGTYKSAVEPFILTGMSDANKEQQEHYLGNIWKSVASTIANNRGVDTAEVNRWADSFEFTLPATEYVKSRVVDRLVYRHEMDDIFARITDRDEPNYIPLDTYAQSYSTKKNKGANIAVLYAVGDITDTGNDGITSEKLVPVIMDMCDNDKIDGLILRVNSPGGSAFASEQIWEALQQFKKRTGKPFYVSMGDVAASGGYYISCGADKIYAEPVTITGSIGIFGMIPDAQTLLNEKLGINTATVATNKGELPGFFKQMSPELAAAMQSYVNRGYETFVGRVAKGRKMPVDSVKAIAEGRVWDGASALRLGLVDEMGGLDKVIADMAAKINGKDAKNGFNILEYPKVKLEWWQELMQINSQFGEKYMMSRLGEGAPYYQALKNIGDMNALQCRMDYIVIK